MNEKRIRNIWDKMAWKKLLNELKYELNIPFVCVCDSEGNQENVATTE